MQKEIVCGKACGYPFYGAFETKEMGWFLKEREWIHIKFLVEHNYKLGHE